MAIDPLALAQEVLVSAKEHAKKNPSDQSAIDAFLKVLSVVASNDAAAKLERLPQIERRLDDLEAVLRRAGNIDAILASMGRRPKAAQERQGLEIAK